MKTIITKTGLFLATFLLAGNVFSQSENLLANVEFEVGECFYTAGGWDNWDNIYTNEAVWEQGALTIDFKRSTIQEWQAQFRVVCDPVILEKGKDYVVSFDVTTTKALSYFFVQVKNPTDGTIFGHPYTASGGNNQNPSPVGTLAVGTTTVNNLTYTPTANVQFGGILFDLGKNPNVAPATVTISNIAISEVEPIVDTDGDGVPDDIDECPDTPAGTYVDATGCEIVDESLLIDNFESGDHGWSQTGGAAYTDIRGNQNKDCLNESNNVRYLQRVVDNDNWAGAIMSVDGLAEATGLTTPITGYRYMKIKMYRTIKGTGFPNVKIADAQGAAGDIAPVAGTVLELNKWQDVVFDLGNKAVNYVMVMADRSPAASLSGMVSLLIDDIVLSNTPIPRVCGAPVIVNPAIVCNDVAVVEDSETLVGATITVPVTAGTYDIESIVLVDAIIGELDNIVLPYNVDNQYVITGLEANAEYTFNVRAVDEEGNESESCEVTFTTLKTEGISSVLADENVVDEQCFTIDGRQVAVPTTGIYIVKKTFIDGSVTTEKKLVK